MSEYGWKIKQGKEWDAFDEAKEVFGAEELLENLALSIGYRGVGEHLAFIFRMYEHRSKYLEKEEEASDV